MSIHTDDPVFTPNGLTLCGYTVEWFDGYENYNDAPVCDPSTFDRTQHRFPDGVPAHCTLHYEDGFNGQPVIIDHKSGIAYGLACV